MSKTETKIKAYKGFDKNLQCRGFQYEVGKEYETDLAEVCESGFHACECPLVVWEFYPPSDGNRFCEVEQSGETKTDGEKTASTKIKIGAEIGIPCLVKAHVEWVKSNAKSGGSNTGTGYYSAATNTGNYSAATNTGHCSAATNTGYCSAAEVKGRDSVAIVAGGNSKARGALGCWLVLTERDEDYHIKCVKAFRIDGKKYKADTWYELTNGKVMEVK